MSNASTPATGPDSEHASAETLTTRLNRTWVIKTGFVLLIGLVLGVWGLYDATVVYPNRGIEDASYKQRLYLREAQKAGQLQDASIPDPAARRGTLSARRAELEEAVANAARLSTVAGGMTPEASRAAVELRQLQPKVIEAAALQWLDALALVGRLDRAHAEIAAPAETLANLEQKWASAPQPLPLAAYDIPVQWLITVVGFLTAAYVIFRMYLPAMRTRFTWDPREQRLTLPGGRSLVPGDIAEFDKRLWDKLYIHLHIKEHAGGGTVKLDLLRYVPLEEWVLAMERTAFPESAAPESGEGGAAGGNGQSSDGNAGAGDPKN
ncbi:MAG: hypothetical protein AB7K52_10800 [Phycisphaerales bacterium]